MRSGGFYNYGAQGTGGDATGSVIITGNANNVIIPTSIDYPCSDGNTFFNGEFTNLGTQDCQIAFQFSDGSQHVHDLRAYETIHITNMSIKKVGVIINGTMELHGMGTLIIAENPNDIAILLMSSSIAEHIVQGRNNNRNIYKKATSSTATTTDVWSPALAKGNIRLWKAIIEVAGACIVTLQWVTQAGGSTEEIGEFNFSGAGTFVLDTDLNGFDNPNYGGKLQMVTSQAVAVVVDAIGNEVAYE